MHRVRRKVLVTGGTGFVGCHTVAALLEQGDEVRLLVRSLDRVASALEPFGITEPPEAQVGDVTDETSVERALEGCEAVVHSASIYTLDSRASDKIRATNVRGTDNVLRAAERRNMGSIVHVSSFVALLPSRGRTLTPDDPISSPADAYCISKADSERVAREYQARGVPVRIVQPGMVWGPNDPHFGESNHSASLILQGKMPLIPKGGVPIVDVRDVAAMLARASKPDAEPTNYLIGGHYTLFKDVLEGLSHATGRKIRAITVPDSATLLTGRIGDALQRRSSKRVSLPPYGATWITSQRAKTDDTRAKEQLGFDPRPLKETQSDTVRSLLDRGHITPKQAGAVAR